jgi:hypothetical protein
MLIFDYWTLDIEPRREVAYERMHHFVNHCNKLGIPNPYSLKESFDADRRWKKLQKFAVPPMDGFNVEGVSIHENLNDRVFAKSINQYDEDFDL